MAQLRGLLPPGATRSPAARSASRRSGSASRAWGVQFHPEVTRADVDAWLDESQRRPRRGARSGSTPRRSAPRPPARSPPGTTSGRGIAARFLRSGPSRRCPLQRREVGGRQAAVHQEGRGVHEGRLVAGQEQRAGGDLARLGEAARREVNQPARGLLRVLGEQLLEQRRVDRARAERVHADAAARELHAELARHRQHPALRGRVGDLRDGGAHHRHERGGVDDRPAAVVEQVRDAELAAEEDRLAGSRSARDPRPRRRCRGSRRRRRARCRRC